jgi:hypothetical protein
VTAVGPVEAGVFPCSGPSFVRSKKELRYVFRRERTRLPTEQVRANRYEYNPTNPVGLALIVLSVAFAAAMLILMHTTKDRSPCRRSQPPRPGPAA